MGGKCAGSFHISVTFIWNEVGPRKKLYTCTGLTWPCKHAFADSPALRLYRDKWANLVLTFFVHSEWNVWSNNKGALPTTQIKFSRLCWSVRFSFTKCKSFSIQDWGRYTRSRWSHLQRPHRTRRPGAIAHHSTTKGNRLAHLLSFPSAKDTHQAMRLQMVKHALVQGWDYRKRRYLPNNDQRFWRP